MAEAIPTSDAALLAAQAKAGQAGVDAYHAAISTLQSQQQSAVQTAMQEAALRGGPGGAPAGAAQSQAGIISAPYDQRIASLTQNLAGYQADQSARTGRMDAYNNAVLAARSYIPQVTEQTVAPIRARADFEVRNTEMAGQQNVAGINAETELTLAKMRAAFQAAQIAAAKKAKADAKAKKMSQGDLSGLMTSRGAAMIGNSGGQISQILSANEADIAKQVQSSAASSAAANRGTADAARNQSYWDLQGATYTGKAILEDKQKLSAQIKAAAGAAATATPGQPAPRQNSASGMFINPATGIPVYIPPTGTQEQMSTSGADIASTYQRMLAQFMSHRYDTSERQVAQLADRAGQLGRVRDSANGRYFNDVIGSLGEQNRRYSAIDSDTQRRVLMTPEQAQGLDPFTREMAMGATQFAGINGPEDFERLVMGSPQQDIDAITADPTATTDQGIGSVYSSQVVKNAMVEVAKQLQAQGEYNIEDGDVANALPVSIPSIYNLLAKQSGQPSSEDAYKTAASAATKAAAATKANDKSVASQDEKDATTGLTNLYGSAPPGNLGSSVDVLGRIHANKPVLDQATEKLQTIVDGWDDKKAMTAQALAAKLRAENVSNNLIELVLYMNGFM